MARIKIFITQVRTQHRVKTKFRDKQARRQKVKRSLSFLDIVFSLFFLGKMKVEFKMKLFNFCRPASDIPQFMRPLVLYRLPIPVIMPIQ